MQNIAEPITLSGGITSIRTQISGAFSNPELCSPTVNDGYSPVYAHIMLQVPGTPDGSTYIEFAVLVNRPDDFVEGSEYGGKLTARIMGTSDSADTRRVEDYDDFMLNPGIGSLEISSDGIQVEFRNEFTQGEEEINPEGEDTTS